MQFRKIAAMAVTGIMTGLSIAGPALAASVSEVGKISDLVTVSDSTVSFPLFVVGATAQTADVAGAVDVAVKLAANSKTTTAVTSAGTTESVTGGVKIKSAGTELTPWAAASSVRSVFTNSDLSTILADGTFQLSSGGSYSYKQYLYLGDTTATAANNPRVLFAKPNDENSPRVAFYTPSNQQLYQYKLTFPTPISLTSAATATEVANLIKGQSFTIMGKDFVVSDATGSSSASNADIVDITVLGGGSTVEVNTGESKTVTFAGKEYKVSLTSVGTETISGTNYLTAIGDVDGASFALRAGVTKDLGSSVNLGAIKVIQVGSAGAGYGKLTIGGEKLKIVESGNVQKGTQAVAGLTSTITAGSGTWSGMTLIYQPQVEKYYKAGDAISEQFANAFTIKFNSIYPDLTDATNRQDIKFDGSGYNVRLTYKNMNGVEVTQPVYYYTGTDAAATNGFFYTTGITSTGYENGQRDIAFGENQTISGVEQDYFIIQAGGFSHIMQFTGFTPSSNQLTFIQDGTTTITISNDTAAGAQLIVDGYTYLVKIVNIDYDRIKVDMNADGYIGTTAVVAGTGLGSYNVDTGVSAGSSYSYLMPKLIASGHGGIWFYKGSQVNSSYATGNGPYYPGLGIGGIKITNESSTGYVVATSNNGVTYVPSASTINVTTGAGYTCGTTTAYTVNYIDFTVKICNQLYDTVNITTSLGATNVVTGANAYPGWVLLESEQQGGTTHSWIHVIRNYSSTYSRAVVTGTTPSSDDTNFAPTSVSDTTGQNKGMTTYGTYVEYDTTAGNMKLSYPSQFTYGNVYVLGPDGVIGAGTTTGTATSDKIVAVTADIVRLDTEVADSDKTGYDMVLVGGPCVNTLVADLAKATDANSTVTKFPYTCESWPAKNVGLITLVKDAFATGKTALVIAGTRAADTDLASRVVQDGTKLAANTKSSVEVSGTSLTDVVVA